MSGQSYEGVQPHERVCKCGYVVAGCPHDVSTRYPPWAGTESGVLDGTFCGDASSLSIVGSAALPAPYRRSIQNSLQEARPILEPMLTQNRSVVNRRTAGNSPNMVHAASSKALNSVDGQRCHAEAAQKEVEAEKPTSPRALRRRTSPAFGFLGRPHGAAPLVEGRCHHPQLPISITSGRPPVFRSSASPCRCRSRLSIFSRRKGTK